MTLIIAVAVITPAAFGQFGPTITQSDLGCISPRAFTVLGVNVAVPSGQTIERVRVYFRTPMTEGDVWFFVEATPARDLWSATLPAPAPGTEMMTYRSEVLLSDGTTAMTDTATVNVSDDCQVGPLADNPCEDAGLIVGTTASQPRMPEGFQSAGIEGVVTEDMTLVAASTLSGWSRESLVCAAAVDDEGIPTAGIVAGALAGAGIVGAIIEHENSDDDVSPN